jgi:arylsulfatase
MEVYAAQVTVMDEGIGRIVKALKETGEFDETLTCFFIDNGACHVEYGPKRAGYYLPTKTRSGGTMIPGNLPRVMPGPENTYQSYGKEWANAGNTPFRFYKSYAHEGGVRTPLIVHWPGRTPGNAWTNTVSHVIDLLPTALELSGATYPREHGGETLWPLEGSSLATVFKNPAAKSSPRTIFWEHGGKRAVRDGDWKAVALGNKKPWELYNLKNDPSELRDLAASEKERLTQLTAKYQAWSKKVGVEKKRK